MERGTRGDAENFYKRDICYIRIFSFVLTQFILYILNFVADYPSDFVLSWDE